MNDSTFIEMTLTGSTTLSDVIAATIPDIPVNVDDSDFDQYLQNNNTTFCDGIATTNTPTKYGVSQFTTPDAKSSISQQTTPVNYFSPVGDSRFNDSLSGLLGSPTPDSPLASNSFFSDLQAVLANECKEVDSLPKLLMDTMTTQPNQDVFHREQQLQLKFHLLQERFPDNVSQLSNFYRYQAAIVETDRFRNLQPTSYSEHYRQSLNDHYDNQLHQIMDRVEKSLSLLEESHQIKPVNSTSLHSIKQRPLLSKKAIRLMEDWYEEHLDHPYPNNTIINQFAEQGNVNIEQVKKWFANKRNRSNNTRTLTEIARKKRKLAMQQCCLTTL